VHEFVEKCNEQLCEPQDSVNLADLINVECVDKCVRDLKDGKSCGHDGLSAEHLKHAHPLLIVQLVVLFRSMVALAYSYVPDEFGKGIIVPLVKNKTGDLSS